MNLADILGKISRIWFVVILFLCGVLFTVLALISLSQPKKDYFEAEGIIESIESFPGDDDETQYLVMISYTDNTGARHKHIEYPAYSSSMKEGGSVKVLYDPAAPEEVCSPGSRFIPYIIFAVGIVSILVSAGKTFAAVKARRY